MSLGFREKVYLLLIPTMSCLFFLPAIAHPNSIIYPPSSAYTDLTVTHWPNAFFFAQAFKRYGKIPLWKPLIMSGTPFAGNPLSGLFYPFNLLFLFLPANAVFNFLIIFHVSLAGLSTFFLMRRGFEAGPFPSFFAALTFIFTPKVMAHIGAGHVGIVYALSWLPLTLLFTKLAVCRGRALFAGLTLAFQFLADVRIAFYTFLILAGYGIWHVQGGERRNLILIPIVFASIAAVQILPMLELMRYSSRSELSLAEAAKFSLPLPYLLGLFLANRGGFHEWVTYVGIPPLIFVVLALSRRKESDMAFFAGLALFSLLFSLGQNAPLFPFLYRLVPGLRWLRVPSRMWFVFAFSISILAGIGLDCLSDFYYKKRAIIMGIYVLFFSFLLTSGFAILYGEMPGKLLAFAFFSTSSVGLLLLRVNGKVPAFLFESALILLLILDLWRVDASFIELRREEEAFALQREVVTYLAEQEGVFRAYSPSYSLPQHLTALFGIETVDGVDPMQLKRYVRFMELAGGYSITGYSVTIPPFPDGKSISTAHRESSPNPVLLGLLNTRYIVADFPIEVEGLSFQRKIGNTYIYENEAFLPRAFVVYRVEVVPGQEEAMAKLLSFDPLEMAFVEGGRVLNGLKAIESAEIVFYSPDKITVRAELDSPGLLVLSEMWYPGWRAYDNGEEKPIYRTGYLLRGVYLDPGQHTVDFIYEPLSLRIGCSISVLSFFGYVAYVVCRRRRGFRADEEG